VIHWLWLLPAYTAGIFVGVVTAAWLAMRYRQQKGPGW
jgi:hypothetical protein